MAALPPLKRWPFAKAPRRELLWPKRLDGSPIVAPCGRCGYGWPEAASHTRLACAQLQIHRLSSDETTKATIQVQALLGMGSQIVRLREEADQIEVSLLRLLAQVQGWRE